MNYFCLLYYLIHSGLCFNSADIPETDWLLDPTGFKATFEELEGPPIRLRQLDNFHHVIGLVTEISFHRLSNGLIRRDFVTEPNFGTLDFYSLEDDSSLLRAFSPESILDFDCEVRNFFVSVGGVTANVPRGYLNRSASMNIWF